MHILYSVWIGYLISCVHSRTICGHHNENSMVIEANTIIEELNNLNEYRNIYNETKTTIEDEIKKLEGLVLNFSRSVDSQSKKMSKLEELGIQLRVANTSMHWQKEQEEQYKRRVDIVAGEWRNRTLNTTQLIADWANLAAKAKILASSQNQTRMARTDLEEELQKSNKELMQMKMEANSEQFSCEDAEQDVGGQQEIIKCSLIDQTSLEDELKQLKKNLEEFHSKKVELEDGATELCSRMLWT